MDLQENITVTYFVALLILSTNISIFTCYNNSMIQVYVLLLVHAVFMLPGSSHSDKEVDPNTPEKLSRTASERKRKRKVDDGGGGVVGPVGGAGGKGARTGDNKKINEYFPKHAGTSPIRLAGSKSPSPQAYAMVSDFQILILFTALVCVAIRLVYSRYLSFK